MAMQDLIKGVYIFKELNESELALIAKSAQEKHISPGQDIFVKGQKANSLFVISSGTIRIYSTSNEGDEIQLSNMSRGDHFGEMSFLDGEPRYATAKATEAAAVIEIPFDSLNAAIKTNAALENKIYKSMARYLCNRLRATSDDLQHVKELKLRHF